MVVARFTEELMVHAGSVRGRAGAALAARTGWRSPRGPRIAGLVLTALLAGACGVRPTGVVYAGEAPVATASAGPSSLVYFLLNGVPVPVRRAVNPAVPQQVFDALLKGPTRAERGEGLTTELARTKAILVRESEGGPALLETVPAKVDLSSGAYAQIYCTGLVLPVQAYLMFPYTSGGYRPAPANCKGAKPVPSTPSAGGGRTG
jgi:hypothetical protein